MENAKTNDQIGVLFWIVGVVALIWNGLGCLNFVQQVSLSGLSTLPPNYQAYIEARPTWAFVSFAVSVFSGLIGAILMLLSSKASVPTFILSGVGALAVTLSTLRSGITSVIIGSAMSVVFAAAFAWYSSRKLVRNRSGWLVKADIVAPCSISPNGLEAGIRCKMHQLPECGTERSFAVFS